MTDWNKRSIELDLSFLDGGNYQAEIFKDGINAGKVAKDYKMCIRDRRTTGMMGEVVGVAAYLCKKQKCLPRDVYEHHLDEFMKLVGKMCD